MASYRKLCERWQWRRLCYLYDIAQHNIYTQLSLLGSWYCFITDVFISTITIRYIYSRTPTQNTVALCFFFFCFLLFLFSSFCQIWVRFEGRCGLSETLSSTPPSPQYIHVYYFLQVWPPACIQKCLQVEQLHFSQIVLSVQNAMLLY